MVPDTQQNVAARVVVALVLTVLLTGAGFVVFQKMRSLKEAPEKAGAGKPRITVRVEAAVRRDYPEMIGAYGTARALRRTTVSAEVAGVVKDLAEGLEAGARVDTETVLVAIDRSNYENARDTAEARQDQAASTVTRIESDRESVQKRLAIAREDLLAAERELERVSGLVETGVLTRSDLDRQRLTRNLSEKEVLQLEAQRDSLSQELARATAEVAAAKAAYDRAVLDLDKSEVRAPFDGIVEARLAEKGARVGPGTPLFTLVDVSRVEVAVALGASRFGEVEVGAPASLWLGQDEEPVWTGKVARLAPTVNPADRTFMAYLLVESRGGIAPIPPGAFLRAKIQGRTHALVVPIPRAAFVEDHVYVVVADEDGTMRVRQRTPVVRRFLPETALVESGIEAGELVVVTNLEQVAEGAAVLLADDENGERGNGMPPAERENR